VPLTCAGQCGSVDNGCSATIDCGSCDTVCGDGTCNGLEDASSCAADCNAGGAVCGDDVCTPDVESCGNCLADCPCWQEGTSCNPNPFPGVCEGTCGDGVCSFDETAEGCAADCAPSCTPFSLEIQTSTSALNVGETLSVLLTTAIVEGTTVTWDFGDGVVSTGTAASHAYATSGVFNVVVTATEANCGVPRASSPFQVVVSSGGGGGGGGAICGNGACEAGENTGNCSQDCQPGCGNGIVDAGETCGNCPSDIVVRPRFSISTTTPVVGQNVTLVADLTTALSDPVTLWDLGNGAHLSGTTLTYQWPAAGQYAVVMTASEPGCLTTQVSSPQVVNVLPSGGGGGSCIIDGFCDTDAGETQQTCAGDCRVGGVCNNNGTCDVGAGETSENCADCVCVPNTCNGRCGTVADGCSGTLDCGACPNGSRYIYSQIDVRPPDPDRGEAGIIYGMGATQVDLDTFSNLLRVETTLESPGRETDPLDTGFSKARSQTAQDGWTFFGAAAVAALPWDEGDCGEYFVSSVHEEGDPVPDTTPKDACTEANGCDAGLCEEFTCEDKCGPGWRCSIEVEGRTFSRRRHCPSCTSPPPSGYRTWSLGVTTDSEEVTGCPVVLPPETPDTVPLNRTILKATHNSYSGDKIPEKPRGSVTSQLDSGVRFLEFDAHPEGFEDVGDFRIGHKNAGDEVDRSAPNPPTNNLTPWLDQVAMWSRDHPWHWPITVMLDFKDDVSFAEPTGGDFVSLNQVIQGTLGQRLFKPADLGDSWEAPSRLTGKIMALLSGGSGGGVFHCGGVFGYSAHMRQTYLGTEGSSPSIGASSSGLVVVAYQGDGDYYGFWTGQYENGRIRWKAYEDLRPLNQMPAIAVSPSGRVALVEVVGPNYRVRVFPLMASGHFDNSAFSQIEFPFAGGVTAQFISDSALAIFAGGLKRTYTVDPDGRLLLSSAIQAAPPSIDNTRVTVGNDTISVFSGSRNGRSLLLYSTPRLAEERIRLDQLMFVERQCPDSGADLQSQAYWGDAAGRDSFVFSGLNQGKMVRAWDFEEGHTLRYLLNAPGFPATNTPGATWYTRFQSSACLIRFGANSFGLCNAMASGGRP